MSAFDLDGCSALITGASAGIGREFVRQLAGRAAAMVLVARRNERLESLAEEVRRANPNVRIYVRSVDLSDQQAITELCAWMEGENLSIDFLINNAGLGDVGPFATGELEKFKQILAVNVTAVTVLTRLLVTAMIKQRRGAILNVSSSASFLPIPEFAVYAATKAYVTSFSEAIRAELRGTGVTVTSLCPGPVPTEFMQVARRGAAGQERSSPRFVQVSAEETVHTALAAVTSGKPVIVPGFIMKVGILFIRLTPMPLLRLVSSLSV